MTGHLRNVSGGDLSAEAAPGSPAASGDRLAHGGGRHMKDWIAAVSSVDGRDFHSSSSQLNLSLFCHSMCPPNISHKTCSRQAEKWTNVQGLPLVHFSAHAEPFFSLEFPETTQRILKKVLRLSR